MVTWATSRPQIRRMAEAQALDLDDLVRRARRDYLGWVRLVDVSFRAA